MQFMSLTFRKTTCHNIKWDHFDILASGKTDYGTITIINDTLFIQGLQPALKLLIFYTFTLCHFTDSFHLKRLNFYCRCFLSRGPFLDTPGNSTGPKSYFEIKVARKAGCVLTSNEVHIVFLANNLTV